MLFDLNFEYLLNRAEWEYDGNLNLCDRLINQFYNVNGPQTHLRKYLPAHLEIGKGPKAKLESASS